MKKLFISVVAMLSFSANAQVYTAQFDEDIDNVPKVEYLGDGVELIYYGTSDGLNAEQEFLVRYILGSHDSVEIEHKENVMVRAYWYETKRYQYCIDIEDEVGYEQYIMILRAK